MSKKKRCFGCMELYEGESLCPKCQFDESKYQPAAEILQLGTILHGRYLLGKMIKQSPVEILYLAWDNMKQETVVLKEYFPGLFAGRDTGGKQGNKVVPSDGERQSYQKGFKEFVREARLLTRFYNLPGIIVNRDFFQENNTAYLVMDYIKGETLKEHIQRHGPIKADKALRMIKPLVHSLDRLHRGGIVHLDICPEHIILTESGKLVLTDFGGVRLSEVHVQGKWKECLRDGFAPAEQYQGLQGAYTDIYGICAVLYYAITGETPVDAREREEGMRLAPFAQAGASVSKERVRSIKKGMAIAREKRFQSMKELYRALYGMGKHRRKFKLNGVAAAVVVLLVFAGGLFLFGQTRRSLPDRAQETPKAQKTESPKLVISNVAGLQLKEAVRELKNGDAALKISVKKKYSDSTRKGYVIRQNTAAGTEYQKGEISEITLIVSKGSQKVMVPDVSGMIKERAIKKIHKAKLKYKIAAYTTHTTAAFGTVIRQSPTVGAMAKRKSYVKLWISEGEIQEE